MATQVSLTDGAVASAGALAIQTNGTTQAVSISTGQVATLAQNPILTSGTANGVAYLNGSKAVTSGSALVFDGTNLGVGVTPSAWSGGAGAKAIQMGGTSFSFLAANKTQYIYGNAYYDGSNNRYINSDYACSYGVNTSGAYQWNIAPSGTAGNAITFTQAMTLDASGRLGIGQTSPSFKLDVTDDSTGQQGRFASSSSSGTSISLTNTATNGRNYRIGSNFVTGSGEFAVYDATAAATRLLIDSSGNLLVGATSNVTNAARLLIQTASDYQLTLNASTTSGSVYSAMNFTQGGTVKSAIYQDHANTRLTIVCNGAGGVYLGAGGTSWTSNSDERLKTVITPFENAAQKVCTLRAGTGRYLTDNENVSRSFLIAQDVQAVLPEAVTSGTLSRSEDQTEYLGLSYTDVIPLLVAAIKELKAEIDTLKGQA